MDWRTIRINQEIRKLDRRLSASRTPKGTIMILREPDRLAASDYNQINTDGTVHFSQFILALTDTWNLRGKAVDRGIEPILEQLRGMDSWTTSGIYEDMRKRRERNEADQERIQNNEIRARASDMRRDFAKATNDINTSTLEKVDYRRFKNGYCK